MRVFQMNAERGSGRIARPVRRDAGYDGVADEDGRPGHGRVRRIRMDLGLPAQCPGRRVDSQHVRARDRRRSLDDADHERMARD
jgi:hypothetical protein